MKQFLSVYTICPLSISHLSQLLISSNSSSLLRDETLVKFFLAEGADPKLDTLILNVCASTSTPAVFDLLLSHGARLHFSFPLHAAAGSNDDAERIPMMEHLVQKHCLDVNSAGDGEGAYRPLHYAVRAGGSEKVKWLLNKGADPRLKNKVSGFQISLLLSVLLCEMGLSRMRLLDSPLLSCEILTLT